MAKFSNLKVGEKLSETQFYNVDKIVGNRVQLTPDSGETISVDKGYVDAFLTSSDQFEKEEKVTKTELTAIFLGAANTVFKVSFFKQVKEADVLKEILEAHQNSAPKDVEKNFKAAIKKAITGEERVLRGFHRGGVDEFGRIHVTDLDITKDASKSYDVRQRLVDPRTISWLIVKGTKYTAK
ncbi:MAG TPA: hypothetical protein VLE44_02340 [Candidatus Saccharimonadales bacterium]|nr:hypothetical protein [Candidatus Saccharimonadales bacterium]